MNALPDFLAAVRAEVGFVFTNPDAQILMPTVAEDVRLSLRGSGLDRAAIDATVASVLAAYGLADHADAPAQTTIAAAIAERHPDVPVIGFPRGAGAGYAAYVRDTGVAAVALDTGVDSAWAAETLQQHACVQGNLDPLLLVLGGEALVAGTRAVVEAFRGGPHVFNLGHGITPDASPDNVARMLEAIRG